MKKKAPIRCAVTLQLISAFVFAPWIIQFLYLLNPKFQASAFICDCKARSVSDLVVNPEDKFCHDAALMVTDVLETHNIYSNNKVLSA